MKFVLLTVAFTGVCMFMGTDRVAAAACNGAPGVPNASWGVTDGIHSNAMAGLRVYAQDGSNGNPLSNTTYTLNSTMPGVPNPLTAPNGSTYNPNERIFDYPPGSAGRWSQKSFTTGETLHRGGGPENAFSCAGWSVLGPGTAAQQGNGFVIDCGEFVGGSYRSTEYWISSITKPSGQNGYWEVRVDGVTRTPNLDNQPMTRFVATNGDNVRIDLIWHPVEQPKPEQGTCNFLDVYNEGTYTNAGGPHPTRARVQVTGVTGVSVNGGGADYSQHAIDGYAPDPNGDFAMRNKTWRYVAEQPTITITVTKQAYYGNGANQGWHTISGGWSQTRTCISTTCSVSVANYNARPNGIVVGGDQVVVTGYITNTSPPDGPNLNWPYLTGTGGNSGGAGVLGPNGGSGYVSLNVTAPTGPPQNWTLSYSVAGVPATAPPCSVTVPVYQSFSLEPMAVSGATGTNENPGTINYNTSITNNAGAPVTAPTTSTFTSVPYSGPSQCANVGPVNTSGPYNPGGPNYTINPASCAPAQVSAGDQFCAEIRFTGGYNQGFVGPGGAIVSTGFNGTPSSRQCVTVTNKPYFKVYGTGASAGTAIKKSNGESTCNGGLLAGWNNNTGVQQRGAGSQLSALALVKITGFASAQKAFNENTGAQAAKLTFANNGRAGNQSDVSVNEGKENPDLGGLFNVDGDSKPICYYIDGVAPPSAGANSQTLPGGSSYGGATGITNSRSVFVNGDVTITGNITYGATASTDNAPSFVLKATGNIYIAPGVTRLDGLFMSDKKIYTCANSSGPITGAGAYDTCKNQLLVHGSFAAEQVKMGRTYGSLRDEAPNPPTPGGSQLGLVWSCGGDTCNPPVSGMRCVNINEAGSPYTWNDNKLCVPSGSDASFAWTYDATGTIHGNECKDEFINAGTASENCLKARGYTHCYPWTAVNGYNITAWSGYNDNILCSNRNLDLTFEASNNNAKHCTRITEPADPGWSGNANGFWLCEPRAAAAGNPTAKGPPFTNCSNRTGATVVTNRTCAAEIFEFSPELFISTPAIQPPNGGARSWDAVTSLPPVL